MSGTSPKNCRPKIGDYVRFRQNPNIRGKVISWYNHRRYVIEVPDGFARAIRLSTTRPSVEIYLLETISKEDYEHWLIENELTEWVNV